MTTGVPASSTKDEPGILKSAIVCRISIEAMEYLRRVSEKVEGIKRDQRELPKVARLTVDDLFDVLKLSQCFVVELLVLGQHLLHLLPATLLYLGMQRKQMQCKAHGAGTCLEATQEEDKCLGSYLIEGQATTWFAAQLHQQVEEIVALHPMLLAIVQCFSHDAHVELADFIVDHLDVQPFGQLRKGMDEGKGQTAMTSLCEGLVAQMIELHVGIVEAVAVEAKGAAANDIDGEACQQMLHLHGRLIDIAALTLLDLLAHQLHKAFGNLHHSGQHLMHLQ